MRRRWIALLLTALFVWSGQALAEATSAHSLIVEAGTLTFLEDEQLLNQWEIPQGLAAVADVYYDEENAYVRVTFENAEGQSDEEDAPIWLCIGWGEGNTLETLGFSSVRQHLLALDQITFPCGLHAAFASLGDAAALHAGLLPCGQAYACDETHLHMAFDCGQHFTCQGGDAAEHQPYESCEHLVCEGMAHPLLDCRIHSRCDANPLAHALRGCGHAVCEPCDCAEERDSPGQP